jgi:hypothetical protein
MGNTSEAAAPWKIKASAPGIHMNRGELTLQAQRPGAQDASIATTTRWRRSLRAWGIGLTNSISVKLDVGVRLPDRLSDKLKNCPQVRLDPRLVPLR